VKQREFEYFGETARAERERTLSEKIYRLSRDLNDPDLSARQRTLLRTELQATLESLESLKPGERPAIIDK